jgi:transcriptional regulator with XRE-family HTH domain
MPMDRVPQTQLKTFGRNLTRLRKARGFTQERLAERANIAPRYLQTIESAGKGCSLAVLIRLRRALDADWDTLLRGIR